jgi:FkbM family methyltransferase
MPTLKSLVRRAINSVGYDIRRPHENPTWSLLGLKAYPFRTVIDVGANEGQFARFICGHFPGATIFAFEPLQGPFLKLRMLESSRSLKAFNCALGDRETETEMYLHCEHSPSSSLLPTTAVAQRLFPFTETQQKVRIAVSTLDLFCNQHQYEIQDDVLVKMDVQGYEERVIDGGPKLLTRARACIVEVNLESLYVGQAGFPAIVAKLASFGLSYAGNLDQAHASDGRVIYLNAVFVRSGR